MITDRIDLSVRNRIVCIQMYVWLDFIIYVIYVMENQCWSKDRALRNSVCYVAQVECDPSAKTAGPLLRRKW